MNDDELTPEERAALAGLLDEAELDDLVHALREQTDSPAGPAATRARVLRAVQADDDAEEEPWQEAADALREVTLHPEPVGDTRARVLTTLSSRRTTASSALAVAVAAAALLVVFAGGSKALAATGYFPELTQTVHRVERLFADAVGVSEPEPAPRPEPRRRAAPTARSVAPPPRPVEAEPAVEAPRATSAQEPRAGAVAVAELGPDLHGVAADRLAPERESPSHATGADPSSRRPGRGARRARPAAPTSGSTDERPAEFDSSEHLLFQEASRTGALADWDRYLQRYPGGRYTYEARYGRALGLIRAGREAQALEALAPFERGVHGNYRQDAARALGQRLRERTGAE